MIKDILNNAEKYYEISSDLAIGFEWLKRNDLINMPDGRYEISDKIYANIQTYQTKNDAPYEAHREYIDIQYMIKGEEKAGFADYSKTSVVEKYNSDKDIEFLKCNNPEYISLKENEFLIFFPHDAHQPALSYKNRIQVKKVVVKIPV